MRVCKLATVGGLLAFDQWTMRPSGRPGLGVELDQSRVKRYADLYRNEGAMYVTGQHDFEGIRNSVPLISGVAASRARFPSR